MLEEKWEMRDERNSSFPLLQSALANSGEAVWQGVFVVCNVMSLPSFPQCQRQLPN